MSRRTPFLPCLLGAALLPMAFFTFTPGGSARAATRLHGPEYFVFPGSGVTPGPLAIGDVDGDGVAEIATYADDHRVHVFAREGGAWGEVFVSTAPLYPSQTPTVRFTKEPAIAPGALYCPGQFLFNSLSYGSNYGGTISRILRTTGGAWSQEDLFTGMALAADGAFDGPALLPANGVATPGWRLVVPGKYLYFDPPTNVYVPGFGEAAPYPVMNYNFDLQGNYCQNLLSWVYGAVAGDFHGDGYHQIAVLTNVDLLMGSTFGASPGGNPGTCWPYEHVTVAAPAYLRAQLLATRLDGDAATDLVVRQTDGTLRLMRNVSTIGNYAFVSSTLPTSASQPAVSTWLTAADLDGDADLDLVQSFHSPAAYEVYLNDGAGSFSGLYTTIPDPQAGVEGLSVGDVDGDGVFDLVLALHACPSTAAPLILILPSRGDGSFGLPPGTSTGALVPAAVATGDFDGNGTEDVALAGEDTNRGDGSADLALVLPNLGGGSFGPANAAPCTSYPYLPPSNYIVPFRPQSSDPLSLELAGYGYIGSAAGNGDGTMQELQLLGVPGPVLGLDAADINGDGQSDVLWTYIDISGNSHVSFDVAGIGWRDLTLTGTHKGVRAVDWNHDGCLDVATLNLDLDQLEIYYLNCATWSWDSMHPIPLSIPLDWNLSSAANPFVVLPFAPSDSKRVIAVRSGQDEPRVEVVRNQGTESAGVYALPTWGREPVGLACGDVDGDGVTDIVFGGRGSFGSSPVSIVTVLRGVAAGPDTFETNLHLLFLDLDISALGAGDITGDGFDDLVALTSRAVALNAGPLAGTGPAASVARPASSPANGGLSLVPARLLPSGTTGVGDDPRGPAPPARLAFAIGPNPARGEYARLRLDLPAAGHVTAALYDLSGRRVRGIVEGERSAGQQSVGFALRDDAGRPIRMGVYFLRVQAGPEAGTHRLVVVR